MRKTFNPLTDMPWKVVIASAALVAITTGTRQSLGLFVRPLAATGLGIATISLVLAVGQFFWGASQPAFGVLAERFGNLKIVVVGGLLLAAGLSITPFLTSAAGLLVSLGVLSAIGCGAASFSVLIGAVSRRVPAAHQPMAAAWINAGGSIGQLVFAPLSQAVIAAAGWATGMWTLAGAALLTLVIARPAVGEDRNSTPDSTAPPDLPLRELVRPAFGSRSYWYLHLGFFTCGFHVAFLVTHLPGEVALCGISGSAAGIALAIIGLMNVVGTLTVGWLARRRPLRILLVCVYALRVLAIGAYLVAPKTILTLYVFASVLGATWLATVPLTAGLVSKLYGSRHVATLFGLTFLTHQIGGFFGAWLGGVAVAATGNYHWIWGLDMGLAALAALATLPVREMSFVPPAVAVIEA